MTLPFVLAIAIVLLSVAGIGVLLAYIFGHNRRKSKKALRIFEAVALCYFLALYCVIWFDYGFVTPTYGILNRVGVVVILSLLIGENIADIWRGDEHNS